jgi:hypothetical protein
MKLIWFLSTVIKYCSWKFNFIENL